MRNNGDPEHLLQDCVNYIKHMDKFFTTRAALGSYTLGHADCATFKRANGMLVLIGGKEIDSLIKHIGKVVELDSYEQAVEKVKAGITAQTNQSMV